MSSGQDNSAVLWDIIFPVLTGKYKRVEGRIEGWDVTAYKVITTVRVDLKPWIMSQKGENE